MAEKHLINERITGQLLLNALLDDFGGKLTDQDSGGYVPSKADLAIVYDRVNKIVFGGKLPYAKLNVKRAEETDRAAKGSFGYNSKSGCFEITFFSEDSDVMLTVVDTVCHEMIHFFDFMFGPLSSIKDKTVIVKDGRQFIGNYDVHGEFFKSYVEKIAELGVSVSEKHYSGMRYFMSGDEVNEKETSNREKAVLAARQFYDSVKTDGLFIVEVDEDGKTSFVMS